MFEHSQEWFEHPQFHQPIPVLNHSSSEEILPNIQPEPSPVRLEAKNIGLIYAPNSSQPWFQTVQKNSRPEITPTNQPTKNRSFPKSPSQFNLTKIQLGDAKIGTAEHIKGPGGNNQEHKHWVRRRDLIPKPFLLSRGGASKERSEISKSFRGDWTEGGPFLTPEPFMSSTLRNSSPEVPRQSQQKFVPHKHSGWETRPQNSTAHTSLLLIQEVIQVFFSSLTDQSTLPKFHLRKIRAERVYLKHSTHPLPTSGCVLWIWMSFGSRTPR